MSIIGLFSADAQAKINKVAEKSKVRATPPAGSAKGLTTELDLASQQVKDYFADSEAILITSKEQLHEYIDSCIDAGYVGIDTETTGLDKVYDTIVGSSLYYPGGVECYIPNKHKVPIFEDYRKNQLSYEDCQEEFQRLVDHDVKCIFANADYDIAMLYKDYKVDFISACYYDVILAWRVIKENELHNGLKELYNKYVLKGKGDPMKFSDFFKPTTFPYCKPEIAKLYAANDAKITYELFKWQLPYVTKTHPKCIKNHLEHIADVVWGIEFPMIRACAELHRTGIYLDKDVAKLIGQRYNNLYESELAKMQDMVQKLIDEHDLVANSRRPFLTGRDFNPNSTTHAQYLLYDLLRIPVPTSGKNKGKKATGKDVISEANLPETNQLLYVRSLKTLISTFTEKLPAAVAPDGRIHASFKSTGAATGRMCIAKGTLIDTVNGSKPIESLTHKDKVYCVTGISKLTGKPRIRTRRVKNKWITGRNKPCLRIKWVSRNKFLKSGVIECTPEHRILTAAGKWVEAQNLKPKDSICRIFRDKKLGKMKFDDSCTVVNIYDAGPRTVYDIEVDKDHNFFANSICVHNSSQNPNLQNIPSRHTDIRHMFRATPEKEEITDCQNQDNDIVITLGRLDTVYLEDGSEKQVKDLAIGDKVELLEDRKEIYVSVKSLSDSPPHSTIRFSR